MAGTRIGVCREMQQSTGVSAVDVVSACRGGKKGGRTEREVGALAGVPADEIAACRTQRAQRAGQHLVQRSLHLALQAVRHYGYRQR